MSFTILTATTSSLDAAESTSLLKQTGFRQFSTEQGLTQNTINSFYQDSNGTMWIATEAGLNRHDGVEIEAFLGPQQIFIGSAVSNVKEDSQKYLWITTFDQIFRLDPHHQQIESFKLPHFEDGPNQENYVIDIIEESADVFWVVSRHGLFRLKPKGKDIQPFASMRQLWQNEVGVTDALYQQNTIWLATDKGLYRFNTTTSSLTKIELPQAFNNHIITKLIAIDNENLMVSSLEGAVIIQQNASPAISANLITSEPIIAATKLDNQIFLSTKDKLYRLNLLNNELQHLFSLSEILPRYSSYKILELFLDNRKKLWIGTESQGAYVWDPNSLKFKTLSSITNNANLTLSNSTLWSFAEDENNNLWIGSDDGLNFVDFQSSTSQSYLTSDTQGLSKDSSRILYVTKVGETLWLATADGLIKFDIPTKQFKKYIPDRVLPHESFFIYSIAHTPQNVLWLASNLGPISFNPTTEDFYFNRAFFSDSKTEEATFVRYTQNKVWIGYANRLETFEPESKQRNVIFKFGHFAKFYDLSLTDIYFEGNKLWVSFNAAGIYILQENNGGYDVVKHLDQKSGFIDNIIHSLISQGDYLWASSHSGLIRIDKSKYHYQVYDFYNGLPTNEFNEGARYQMSNGNLLFGGSNGLLEVNPEKLNNTEDTAKVQISKITTPSQSFTSNGVDWSQRQIQVSDEDGMISFNVSSQDFLSPHKWQYEYWVSGDYPSSPTIITSNKINISNLPLGNYQLNIRATLPNYQNETPVTSVDFSVVKSSTGIIDYNIVALVLLFATTAWFLLRKHMANQKLALANDDLTEKKQQLEFALLDKHQGVWDWRNFSGNIQESTITIVMGESENIVIAFSKYQSYVRADDMEANQIEWQKFLQGEINEIALIYRIYMFEKWIWCRIHGKVFARAANGTPLRATGTWLDISQEKSAEEALQLYRNALESTRDIIFILDHTLKILTVNKAYHQYTGYHAEGLIGRNLVEVASKRFDPEVIEKMVARVKAKKSWQGEATMPNKNAPSFEIDVRIDPFDPNEENTNYIMVMTDISSLSNRMENEFNSSYYDSITGLPNRVLAVDRLSHAIAHARLHKSNVVLIYLDLNKFDFYQQTLGKSSSREIIVSASKKISRVLKKDDTFARIERDKFFIILENEDKLENISFKIEAILFELAKTQKINNSQVNLTANIGVACFPSDAASAEKLIERAEQALTQARSIGYNRVSYYHKDMNKRASDKLAMKSSLKYAIDNNQFFLVYQPKFELKTKQINGFEVFVRWRTAEGNIIYPSQFIKVAEDTGLIESLTDWLINQAFRILNQWKQEGINTVFSINLIPKYCEKVGSPDYLLEKLAEYDLSPMNIQIEINERHFTQEISGNIDFINELTHKGFVVTLDDFGTGNTPLSYLKHLGIDSLKLERNFIRSIGKDHNNDALLKSIIQMANSLGHTPAAKSIEYQEQLDFLVEAGCLVGQGYYFSDPLTESSARQFMINGAEKLIKFE